MTRAAIPRHLLARMYLHAYDERPAESCGILAGPPGATPVKYHPVDNVSPDRGRYEMDPEQQRQVYRDLDALRWEPWAVVHSHPDGPFTLSGVDVSHARNTPEVLQVVVWPLWCDSRDLVVWRVDAVGGVTPVEFTVVN